MKHPLLLSSAAGDEREEDGDEDAAVCAAFPLSFLPYSARGWEGSDDLLGVVHPCSVAVRKEVPCGTILLRAKERLTPNFFFFSGNKRIPKKTRSLLLLLPRRERGAAVAVAVAGWIFLPRKRECNKLRRSAKKQLCTTSDKAICFHGKSLNIFWYTIKKDQQF